MFFTGVTIGLHGPAAGVDFCDQILAMDQIRPILISRGAWESEGATDNRNFFQRTQTITFDYARKNVRFGRRTI